MDDFGFGEGGVGEGMRATELNASLRKSEV